MGKEKIPRYRSKEYLRERYQMNKEYAKAYYLKNKEVRNAYSKKYYSENKEYILENAKNNPRYKEKRKAWVEKNREYMRNYHREYYRNVLKPKRESSLMTDAADLSKWLKKVRLSWLDCEI